MGRRHFTGAGTYKFLFVRTRLAVDLASDALAPLGRALAYSGAELFMFPGPAGDEKDEFTWDDGMVIRFSDDRTCAELAEAFKTELAAFDAWAVHDCCKDWIEHPAGGPASTYFRSSAATDDGSAMLFLCGHEDGPGTDDLAGQVRERLPQSVPVFFFRGGRILMSPASDPYRVLVNRVGKLADRFSGFSGRDREGVFFNRGEEHPWMWRELEENGLDFDA